MTMAGLLGEVLLCLKDSNAKAREAAYQLLLLMARVKPDDDLAQFSQMVLAALAAHTPHMRSAAVRPHEANTERVAFYALRPGGGGEGLTGRLCVNSLLSDRSWPSPVSSSSSGPRTPTSAPRLLTSSPPPSSSAKTLPTRYVASHSKSRPVECSRCTESRGLLHTCAGDQVGGELHQGLRGGMPSRGPGAPLARSVTRHDGCRSRGSDKCAHL